MDDIVYFESPAAWRAWLEVHHATEPFLWVGFHKVGTGKPSLTWPQSVDEALCFGWNDGRRQRVDDERYKIRFTPRKKGSIWSAINVARMAELDAEGRLTPAGRAAFEGRRADKTAIYRYEQRDQAAFDPAEEALLKANAAAWADWQARPPHYRSGCTYWVVTAKKPETRKRRLETLIECSAAGEPIPPYRYASRK